MDCLKQKKAKLVVITEDASEKTRKNMQYVCQKNNVKIIIFGKKDKLSHIIGKDNKVVIALKEKNIADEIEKRFYGGDAIE